VAEVVDVGGGADGVHHDLVRQSHRLSKEGCDPAKPISNK
jgi:hypothetical protein